MNDFFVSLMLLGALSQGGSMPFWATANQYGLMPESSGGLALLQAGMPFDESKTLQWHWGTSLGLRADANGAAVLPDELYAGLRWKQLRLDMGLWHPEQDFMGASRRLGTLSVTGGNIMQSGNARSMPGYSLTLEPWNVPFTNGHLQVFGRFGDYRTTDARYVTGALVHNTEGYIRGNIGGRFSFTWGLDHFTIWGGTSPEYGPQTVSMGNYFRIITGRSGKEDSPLGDQINSLGDHRGRILHRLDWKGDGWTITYHSDKPYDDRSGMLYYNFPDGVRTLHFGFEDKSRWLSDVVYEYHTTMKQSGPYERRLATEEEIAAGDPHLYRADGNSPSYLVAGGADNYCNNYEYKSGWTHYGRQIGSPLFFSRRSGKGTWNNLYTAHHVAFSGSLFRKYPWKLMLTVSNNYGCWFSEDFAYNQGSRLEQPLKQFSSGFMTEFPLLEGALRIVPAVYLDAGDALPRRFGAILSVKYDIIHIRK